MVYGCIMHLYIELIQYSKHTSARLIAKTLNTFVCMCIYKDIRNKGHNHNVRIRSDLNNALTFI